MSAPVDVLACFACGKKFRNLDSRYLADTRDGQEVFIGPECLKRVQAAGDAGYQPDKGGPRLYPLSVDGVLADMDSCTRACDADAAEILCQAGAAVAELMEALTIERAMIASGERPPLDEEVAIFARTTAALARCQGGAK